MNDLPKTESVPMSVRDNITPVRRCRMNKRQTGDTGEVPGEAALWEEVKDRLDKSAMSFQGSSEANASPEPWRYLGGTHGRTGLALDPIATSR